MIKNFPKSRVCAIDVYPALERGIKTSVEFAQKHNLTLASADGKRLLASFCIASIKQTFKEAQSPYQKVLFVSTKSAPQKIATFVNEHFDKIVSKCPFPYCGIYEINSPDLEMAARAGLQNNNRALSSMYLPNN